MKAPPRLLAYGCLLILLGALIAHITQTSGGTIVKDIRFSGSGGTTLSALLYIPSSATAESRAPGILAVHGYINSREAQSGFAIEFARRGYVVLALDQSGHGYSDPPAFANGFGGPHALAYLRSLDIVDTDNIGLEGHSMGGWAVLAAAAALPDGYRAMVLEGSSTGAPFAAEGTPTWPRNVAVVFSRFDEFAQTMWAVPDAQDVSDSAKLQTLFGTKTRIEPGRIYGEIETGSARILYDPPVTHPGDHLSRVAIGHAIDWFARTLQGGNGLPSHDQIWPAKELGTLIALIGFVVLLLGGFQSLLGTPRFRSLYTPQLSGAFERRNARWWTLAVASASIPVATFYPLFALGESLLPPSRWLPQGITNQIMLWALGNGLIAALLGFSGRAKGTHQPAFRLEYLKISLATIGIGYTAVLLVGFFLQVDLRFWFVGLKALSPLQFEMALIYVVPFILYFVLALRGLHTGLSVAGDGPLRAYVSNGLILTGGFIAFLMAQYTSLFATGALLTPDEPLNTIVMIQFVPLLLIVSIISTFTFRRTGRALPGALICALFVTWYIVAGQATQSAV